MRSVLLLKPMILKRWVTKALVFSPPHFFKKNLNVLFFIFYFFFNKIHVSTLDPWKTGASHILDSSPEFKGCLSS